MVLENAGKFPSLGPRVPRSFGERSQIDLYREGCVAKGDQSSVGISEQVGRTSSIADGRGLSNPNRDYERFERARRRVRGCTEIQRKRTLCPGRLLARPEAPPELAPRALRTGQTAASHIAPITLMSSPCFSAGEWNPAMRPGQSSSSIDCG